MRIESGTQVTAKLDVTLHYKCSRCGSENETVQTLVGVATSSFMTGATVQQRLQEKAHKKIKNTLVALSNPNDPRRFRNTNFSCKCKDCHHREPWAKLRHAVPSLILVFSLVGIFLFTFVLGFQMVTSHHADQSFFVYLYADIISIAAAILSRLYMFLHTKIIEKKIAAMPPESLPTIRLTKLGDSAPVNVTANHWRCRHCGTENLNNYAQCKQCGKYKGQ